MGAYIPIHPAPASPYTPVAIVISHFASEMPSTSEVAPSAQLDRSAPPLPESGTLYYLRIKKLDGGLAIAGPYIDITDVAADIAIRLQESPKGMEKFMAETEMCLLINQIRSVTGPLASDPSKSITIDIIHMKNPEMAARLPGPAFNVIGHTPLSKGPNWDPLNFDYASTHIPRQIDVLGCRATRKAAKKLARQILKERAEQYTDGEVVPFESHPEGTSSGLVVVGKEKEVKLLVSVERDPGKTA